MGTNPNTSKYIPNPQRKDYKFSIKLYPDCTEYDAFACVRKLESFFEQYAWIIHDSDKKSYSVKYLRRVCVNRIGGAFRKNTRIYNPYLKPHIHFYGKNNCHCRITVAQIIKYLEIPYHYAERPNEFAPASDWLACMFYTVHRNAPDKFQYDVEKVKTNVPRFAQRLCDTPMLDDLKILYELLDEYFEKGEMIHDYELPRLLALRGCTIQLARWSMVKDISHSYQYNKLGRVVD